MAIVQMCKISVYALKKHRKAILEFLQREGTVEIINSPSNDVFEIEDLSSQQAQFLKFSSVASQAWQTINKYCKEDKAFLESFNGRKNISSENYYTFVDNKDEIMSVAAEVNAAEKRQAELKAEIIKIENRRDALRPWLDLDVPMRFKGTGSTRAFIGLFQEQISRESLLEELAKKAPDIVFDIEIISSSSEQTCVFILCNKKYAEQAETALRALGFAYPQTPSKQTPRESEAILQKRIEEYRAKMADCVYTIEKNVGMRHAFKFMEDYFVMRADKYEMIKRLSNSHRCFVLTGYAPKKDAEKLESKITKRFGAYVELEDPGSAKDVPTVLHNNAISRPVEGVISTYSMPQRNEPDPTFIMSIFYYILFGIMFSDAGYGLVMTLACFTALKKFKGMESGLKRSVKMFMYCGISTMFWGIMFGSFFGDAISVISETFFNHKIVIDALWFNPVTNPMRMLMFSFALGIVHLFSGLGILAYKHIKSGHAIYAVYDTLSWYFIVGGAVLYLLSQDMMAGITGIKLPQTVGNIGGILAIIGAVIVLIFAGRESVNPVKRILKGAYGLYGITGYLSDILSYSRLLALGLATGVIGQVFNQIAAIGGSGFVGTILFIVVFVVGHTLNIGINALGAYVHTNRLQFVEFFNKFYEGDGKPFEPFAVKTKYYNIKEEF